MESLHVTGQPLSELPVHKHKHVHTGKRARGRFTYNLKDPKTGSNRLAIKNHFIAMIGEFVGTCLFMLYVPFRIDSLRFKLIDRLSPSRSFALGGEDFETCLSTGIKLIPESSNRYKRRQYPEYKCHWRYASRTG